MCLAFLQFWCNVRFIVNLPVKTDSTVLCVPCMLEHVCYESLSLKNYVNWLNFVYCLKFTSLKPD